MKRKLAFALASALAITAGSLSAQTSTTETTTTTSSPAASTTTTEKTTTITSGKTVMDASGAELGTVERVISKKGSPGLVVLRTGERTVVVPRNVITVSGDTVTYSGERSLITSAPAYTETTTYETREAAMPIYKHFNVEVEDGEIEVDD